MNIVAGQAAAESGYPSLMNSSPQDILKNVFGYSKFKGQQQHVIEAALQGRDSLVIMPTGGGKSLCYQIPAMLREGTGLIVSPLIALMQDQVSALQELGIAAGIPEFQPVVR